MCLPFQRFCCDICDSGCCDNEDSGSVRRHAASDEQPATRPQAQSGHGNGGQPFLEGGKNGNDAAAQTTAPVETAKNAAADKTKGRAGSRKKDREGDADVNKTSKNPLWMPTSYKTSDQKNANNNGGRGARPVLDNELQAADGNKNGGNRPAVVDNSGEGNSVPCSSGGGHGRNDATEKILEPTMVPQARADKEPVAASPRFHGTKVSTGKMTAPQQIPQMDYCGEDDDYNVPTAAASVQALATSNVHGGRDNGDGHDKGDRRTQRGSWW